MSRQKNLLLRNIYKWMYLAYEMYYMFNDIEFISIRTMHLEILNNISCSVDGLLEIDCKLISCSHVMDEQYIT